MKVRNGLKHGEFPMKGEEIWVRPNDGYCSLSSPPSLPISINNHHNQTLTCKSMVKKEKKGVLFSDLGKKIPIPTYTNTSYKLVKAQRR